MASFLDHLCRCPDCGEVRPVAWEATLETALMTQFLLLCVLQSRRGFPGLVGIVCPTTGIIATASRN